MRAMALNLHVTSQWTACLHILCCVQGAKCGAEFGQWGAEDRASMLSFSSNFGFLQHAST